ncbi:hypothetical protein GCM10010987_10790 [Bradyrhizobium guangdongense]|uniref:Uncharacterized protein n=1 Tax=Bradyrhizobium guangdongense TaxID=1325090 RepID=A0AA88B539_9BRAD|nr:hypothetical protein GCM10010987_10790 [Bradyrhizobium guangdongense]
MRPQGGRFPTDSYQRAPSLSAPARDPPFKIDLLELDSVRIRETEYDLVITGKGTLPAGTGD